MVHEAGFASDWPVPSLPSDARVPERARHLASVATTIGGALEGPLDQAQRIVHGLTSSGKITRAELLQLGAALDDAREIALQARQLGALRAAPLSNAHAPRRLDLLVSQSLARQMPMLRRHRVQVQQQSSASSWMVVDGGHLPELIDAAFAWCMWSDHRLVVAIEASGNPATVLLRFRLGTHSQDDASGAPRRQLSWQLLQALARTCGARLQHHQEGATTMLTLALQCPEHVVPDPAPGDLLTTQDSLLSSSAVPLQHQRVLLVTRHEEVRAEVEHVCASLGASLDWVATGAAAVRQFAQARADLVLVDERSADPAGVRLQQQVLLESPEFPWITISKDISSASLTHWMRDDCLTLANLRAQLTSTLLYGLSRVRTP